MHLFLALSSLVVLFGCGQQEEITSYKVKKPELVDPTFTAAANRPAGPATVQQTLGLIVPVGDTSWFFKLTGETTSVEPQEAAFLEFAKTIKFSTGADAKPTWTLPTGWKEFPGNEFRFATIRLPESESDAKPLEISVSPAGGDVLANINRWRGQLNLKPIAAADMSDTTKALQIDGRDATFVSLVGTGSGQMGGAPFAPFAGGSGAALPADHPPIAGPSAPPTTKAPASDDLQYVLPAGWSPGKPNAFSQIALQVADGDKKAEITVSEVGGDMLSNVNRWRGQIGLSQFDAAALAKETKKIETFGTTGDYVQLVGPAGEKQQSILGVRIEAEGRTLFVKFRGDADLAQREKSHFEEFVKSLRAK
jgi:hypothetical protein